MSNFPCWRGWLLCHGLASSIYERPLEDLAGHGLLCHQYFNHISPFMQISAILPSIDWEKYTHILKATDGLKNEDGDSKGGQNWGFGLWEVWVFPNLLSLWFGVKAKLSKFWQSREPSKFLFWKHQDTVFLRQNWWESLNNTSTAGILLAPRALARVGALGH